MINESNVFGDSIFPAVMFSTNFVEKEQSIEEENVTYLSNRFSALEDRLKEIETVISIDHDEPDSDLKKKLMIIYEKIEEIDGEFLALDTVIYYQRELLINKILKLLNILEQRIRDLKDSLHFVKVKKVSLAS